MNKTRHQSGAKILLGLLAGTLLSASVGAQNMIINPGFEDVEAPVWGNNLKPRTPDPWDTWALTGDAWQYVSSGRSNRPNLIKVDGAAAHPYNTSTPVGPEFDANPETGAGVAQQYLDISGRNDIYQTLQVPQCGVLPLGETWTLAYSGWFSPREDRGDAAGIAIYEGQGIAGAVLASVTADIPAAINGDYIWQELSGTVDVTTGSQISYVASVENYVHFDEASLTFASACPTAVLTLAVEWENALPGDEASLAASVVGGADLGELVSTAVAAVQTDTLASPLYVTSGDVIDLSALNQPNYTSTLDCSGAGVLSGNAFSVDDSGDSISCTLRLTRTPGPAVLSAQPVPAMPVWALFASSLLIPVLLAPRARRQRR